MEALSQPMQALEVANTVRMVQKTFKRNVAAMDRSEGLLMVQEVIADPPISLGGMRVEPLLLTLKGVGITKTHRVLRDANVSGRRKVRDLTDGERHRLLKAVPVRLRVW